MEAIQIFNFNGSNIRIIEKNGEPWFVLKDICDVLGLRSPDVRQRLSDDVVSTHTVTDILGRANTATIINEDGLYDVILESRKPEARKFRKWVTSEVLPSIRKHGAYMTQETLERALAEPDFLIQLATKLKEEREARRKLEEQIEQDRPYTNFAKSIANSSDAITFGEFAKILANNGIRIGRNRLFRWMRNNGYLIKKGREKNIPMQQYVEQGLFQVKESVVHTIDKDLIRTTTLITGKGQLYFLEKLKEEFLPTEAVGK